MGEESEQLRENCVTLEIDVFYTLKEGAWRATGLWSSIELVRPVVSTAISSVLLTIYLAPPVSVNSRCCGMTERRFDAEVACRPLRSIGSRISTLGFEESALNDSRAYNPPLAPTLLSRHLPPPQCLVNLADFLTPRVAVAALAVVSRMSLLLKQALRHLMCAMASVRPQKPPLSHQLQVLRCPTVHVPSIGKQGTVTGGSNAATNTISAQSYGFERTRLPHRRLQRSGEHLRWHRS